MRRRRDLISRPVDGRVVGLDLQSSQYFSVNSSGALLWEILEDEASPEQLAEVLVQRFGIERAAADADVEAFLTELRGEDLLE